MSKTIVSLQVIRPGSAPDVDSDFNTKAREQVINHVKDVYGVGNVAAIGTFNTLAAKGAFKTMCTIYEVPFAQANKLSDLIPKPAEGMEVTMADIFDPSTEAYGAAADFRSAVAGNEWKKIIEGAKAIESRNKSVGVHPCGIIISSQALIDTVPLQVRQEDGLIISQWTYPELESLGLIKMDFLGLDTVDLIQHTIENIMQSGKNAPNMLELIHGPMDDAKTFAMLSRGDTIGLFQLASPGVQDLLKRMKPTSINDIIATTALFRPGPMGMNSHIKYADRKAGREEVDYVHPEFKGSPLEDILGPTFGLCVPKGTPILNSETGVYLPIEDLRPGMKTAAYNEETHELEEKTIERVVATGKKRILELRTTEGRTLRLSETHPVLTPHGYEPLGSLRPGAKLAVTPFGSALEPRKENWDKAITKEVAYQLGKEGKEISLQVGNEILRAFLVGYSENHATPESFPKRLFKSVFLRLCVPYEETESELILREESQKTSSWLTAVAITPVGEEECYDIEVEGLHNFLVDGFVVHNCVYQEQIIRIANRIAGMSLQEGDALRKAMGKKIMAKMLSMKPKFIEGGKGNGYSEEAMNMLWDTVEEFARYGFNLAHSVAYGITAYETAYLKAHYPVEFMAALISQNVGNKEKVLAFLQEAQKMGLKIGPVDVNQSQKQVAPALDPKSPYNIIYGFAGVDGVSQDTADIIIKEREENGHFKSVQDMIDRCFPLGVSNRKIYENLAKAGGFDSFGVSRRAVVENLNGLLSAAKTKDSKGSSLFDLFGEGEVTSAASIDLTGMEEYPHVKKLQMEADVVGLYLTSHPMANMGPGLSKARTSTIADLFKLQQRTTVTITAAVTEITKKILRRGGKSVVLTMDDGTGFIKAKLSREIVKSIDKKTAQERLRKLYEQGATEVPSEMETLIRDTTLVPMKDVEKNNVYTMTLVFRPERGQSPYGAMIQSISPLALADDGSLPIRMRLVYDENNEKKAQLLAKKLPKAIAERNPGKYPIFLSLISKKELRQEEGDAAYLAALDSMVEAGDEAEEELETRSSSKLWEDKGHKKAKSKNDEKKTVRSWPPKFKPEKTTLEISYDSLPYEDTGYRAAKTKKTELDIEKYLGVENYDFGVFLNELLEA